MVEGNSASAYPNHLRSMIQNGNNYFGIYPLRGKLINAMTASYDQIWEGREITDLRKIIGVMENVDYTQDENYQTLQYGRIIILTDADDDGKHIAGLILNLFHCRFPSLLARGYMNIMRTPVLVLMKGKQKMKFYSTSEYEEAIKANAELKNWETKYLKGLGSSSKELIADYFQEMKIVSCVYDDLAPDKFKLAFDKKFADERKKWIFEWSREEMRRKLGIDIEFAPVVNISDFILHEVVQYSIANVHRSIPRLLDGLKVSPRKVLWTAQSRQGYRRKPKPIKNITLAGATMEFAHYHHGDNSLVDAVVTMTQDFVGANNMPYFYADGEFGTRVQGGRMQLRPVIHLLF